MEVVLLKWSGKVYWVCEGCGHKNRQKNLTSPQNEEPESLRFTCDGCSAEQEVGPITYIKPEQCRKRQIEVGAPVWFERMADGKEFGIDFQSGLDHARHFGNIALFATYPRECQALMPVLNFCREAGLVVHIGGKSFYSPETTAIAIYRREDEAQFREFQDRNTEYEEA